MGLLRYSIFAFILLKLGIFLASLLLRCKDFLINLAGFEQFLVRAVCADVTVVQHQNMVGILYRRDTLGNDELGRVRDFLAECLTDERVGLGVDGRGRVVQNQNLGLFEQSAG